MPGIYLFFLFPCGIFFMSGSSIPAFPDRNSNLRDLEPYLHVEVPSIAASMDLREKQERLV